jgi:hypothetical protein
MLRPLTACLVAAAALALPAAARAETPRFYFRGALGVGYGGFFTTGSGPSITLRGLGAMGNFAVGVNLSRAFAIHIDACAMALVTPTVLVNGTERTSAQPADSTTTLSIIGGGVTWRHPSQFWASLSGGVAIMGVEIPGATCRDPMTGRSFDCSFALTELGGGANVLVGRSWPLAYGWRIGASVHAIFAAVPDRADTTGAQPLWITLGGGASLVVTDQ